jgi:very-short-patch-repair endonuclease
LSGRDPTQQQRAQKLRKEPTATEQLLWSRLRRRQLAGHKFRRQQVLGPFIVDFVCLEKKLIVELDGGQHAERRSYDQRRTRWLERHGFRVLRFWDNQVFGELEAVLKCIEDVLCDPPPSSSPTPPE